MDNNDEEQRYINGLRDKVMENFENLRHYSTAILKHAIDSYQYRGPLFPENADSLEAFLPVIKDIARSLSDWIIRVIEEQEEVLEELPEVIDPVDPELVPEADPLFKRVARSRRAYKEGRIGPLAFFNEALELAKELLDEIKKNWKHIMVICPTLTTVAEINQVYELVYRVYKTIEEKDKEQKRFELKEDEVHAHHRNQIIINSLS